MVANPGMMVAMFDGGWGSSTIILKEYYICIKFNCNILYKGFFLDFLIDFFADFTPMFYL
jgi:hypothetical protein